MEATHAVRGSLGTLRVLLVEDDEPSALVARGALESFGCQVTWVETGDASVPMAVAPGFDIVLMDCRLPVMNGLLATAAIRQWESLHGAPRIAILGLTASSMPEERLGCLDAGMDDVLSKPLLFPKLYDALLRWKPASV